jgi:hypothetical protein
MFSVDHPYQSVAEGRAFLEQLPVNTADEERIVYGNAEKTVQIVRRSAAAFNARSRLKISSQHRLALQTDDDL